MAASITIQQGSQPKLNIGLFEFSSGSQVEVKVKANKSPQAKEPPQTYPTSTGKFTLSRLVINLQVLKNDNEISPVTLHVRKQGNENTLAYLSNNQWVKMDTSLDGEFLVASHKDWPSDPAVGIGQSS